MQPQQWNCFKRVAKGKRDDGAVIALIVDSPWIPGYLGLRYLDYYFDPEVWFHANLALMREFPQIVLLPSWWVEYGMAVEPSALGCRIRFHADQAPTIGATLAHLEDIDSLAPVDPQKDGLMAAALHRYRTQVPRILAAGYTVPMVAARGPLCLAAFLRGLSQFLLDIAERPEAVHRLLELTTATVIGWLRAQAETIGETVEGIFVLDDIVGMLSAPMYRRMAHPYLRRIAASFPAEWVKVYHNDANVRPFLGDLADTGFDVLNWSHRIDIREARERAGAHLCLMGNIAPLELGVNGEPDAVHRAARDVLAHSDPHLILSFGGGVSPGTPKANIVALAGAAAI